MFDTIQTFDIISFCMYYQIIWFQVVYFSSVPSLLLHISSISHRAPPARQFRPQPQPSGEHLHPGRLGQAGQAWSSHHPWTSSAASPEADLDPTPHLGKLLHFAFCILQIFSGLHAPTPIALQQMQINTCTATLHSMHCIVAIALQQLHYNKCTARYNAKRTRRKHL